jgi:precorrin-6A synthase
LSIKLESSERKSEAVTEIYWGAYLGTEDEILVSGNLRELADDIERMRKEAKARKGWIMDTYFCEG